MLPHRVMAPTTLGTFLGAFTFGHVRQLDAVLAEVLRRDWVMGAGPESDQLVVDQIDHLRGVRQGQGWRRLRLHQTVRLPPFVGHPR